MRHVTRLTSAAVLAAVAVGAGGSAQAAPLDTAAKSHSADRIIIKIESTPKVQTSDRIIIKIESTPKVQTSDRIIIKIENTDV